MQQLVSYIVKEMVEFPDQVEITMSDDAGISQMVLKVAESDKGKVIGKQGKVIKAIRALVSAACEKKGSKVHLEIA
jgi:uncharacterized protein